MLPEGVWKLRMHVPYRCCILSIQTCRIAQIGTLDNRKVRRVTRTRVGRSLTSVCQSAGRAGSERQDHLTGSRVPPQEHLAEAADIANPTEEARAPSSVWIFLKGRPRTEHVVLTGVGGSLWACFHLSYISIVCARSSPSFHAPTFMRKREI